MQLHHEAELDAPLSLVWARAKDGHTVAAAFPGGQITDVSGDRFSGQVSVGVGLVRLTYRGDGRYEVVDETAHRAVIAARGRQRRGPGRADIRATLQLHEVTPTRTRAVLDTELAIGGAALPLAGPLGERVAAPLVAVFMRRLGAPERP